jgi:O-antigen ligase
MFSFPSAVIVPRIKSSRGQAATLLIMLAIVGLGLLAMNAAKFTSYSFLLFFVGIFVFILAFLKTNVALGILIVSMLFSPEMKMGQLSERAVTIRFDDIILIVVFFGWLAKLAIFKELGLLKKTPLNVPILIYLFVCLVSVAFMLIGGEGSVRRSLFYFLKYFEYFLVYFLVVNNIENMGQAKIFVLLMVVTCVLVGLYGLRFYHQTGLRATAPFEGPEGEANTLAGYLTLLMGVMLGLLVHFNQPRQKSWLLMGLGIAFLTLLFTLSRSGWVSFAVMYVAFVFLSRRGRPVLIVGLIVMGVLAPIVAPRVIKERVEETFVGGAGSKLYRLGSRKVVVDESGSARIDSWKMGFEKMIKRPILGYGIPTANVVDNQYTRVMVETGILGSFAFIWLLWGIYKAGRFAIEASVYSGDVFAQGLSVGFLAGFFGLLVHAMTAATFILIRIMEPFWFFMAIIVLLPQLVKAPVETEGVYAGT